MKLIGAGYETIHDSHFKMRRPHGYGDYLLLVMKTESFHVLEGTKHTIPADTMILYDETSPQYYGATKEKYIDDWIHFSMEENELSLFETLKIPFNTQILMKDVNQISNLIQTITFEFYSANEKKENTGILYLQILFNKINEILYANTKNTLLPFYNQLVTLRTEIYNAPTNTWKVDDMSKKLNLSMSYFQHIYKKVFGISVINDVINSRISHSKKLLAGTMLPMKKIAQLCGYEYDIYFMRQFKNRTGMTPKEYRKEKMESDQL